MEIRNKILFKADEICRKVGFRAMTLDDIASKLNISKKTIYQYFEDKDALVDAIMDIEVTNTKTECLAIMEIAENAIDEIFRSIEFMTKDLNEMNPIILHDLYKFYPNAYQKVEMLKNTFFYDIIANNLKKGIKEGYYRKNINVDILTKMRLQTLMLGFEQNIFPSISYNIVDVNKEILMHFLHGIASEKGQKLINEYLIKSINNA